MSIMIYDFDEKLSSDAKDINTFAMRVREWYGYHFPELVKLVNDNYQYCQLVKLIKNRKCLTAVTDEMLEGIEKIVMDSAKSQAICDCARASMGMDISDFDLINIEIFANKEMFKNHESCGIAMPWVPFSFQKAFERAFTTCWQVHEKKYKWFLNI